MNLILALNSFYFYLALASANYFFLSLALIIDKYSSSFYLSICYLFNLSCFYLCSVSNCLALSL